ncbi:hypothetical protein EYF80_031779 [Liparis tanakae]|uniref:Uncharacterized protein n=1 Tax=Liparis tanakae TaxID=230148 RepID=A0A4Z2GXJ0_9TELE|nr:hypothetical protein EYF80_031779 [Liparis tanakae]
MAGLTRPDGPESQTSAYSAGDGDDLGHVNTRRTYHESESSQKPAEEEEEEEEEEEAHLLPTHDFLEFTEMASQ